MLCVPTQLEYLQLNCLALLLNVGREGTYGDIPRSWEPLFHCTVDFCVSVHLP